MAASTSATAPVAAKVTSPATAGIATFNGFSLIDEMSATELEAALTNTLREAKKVAWSSQEATPEALMAMLAMFAVQEVHSLGYRPPSAIRAIVKKIKNPEKIATITCLHRAKRELINEFAERRARNAGEDGTAGAKGTGAAGGSGTADANGLASGKA